MKDAPWCPLNPSFKYLFDVTCCARAAPTRLFALLTESRSRPNIGMPEPYGWIVLGLETPRLLLREHGQYRKDVLSESPVPHPKLPLPVQRQQVGKPRSGPESLTQGAAGAKAKSSLKRILLRKKTGMLFNNGPSCVLFLAMRNVVRRDCLMLLILYC